MPSPTASLMITANDMIVYLATHCVAAGLNGDKSPKEGCQKADSLQQFRAIHMRKDGLLLWFDAFDGRDFCVGDSIMKICMTVWGR